MFEHKEKWMSPEDIKKEQEILNLLNDKSIKKTDKAKKLGYKKGTVYLDDKKRQGWYDVGMDLHLTVTDLIESKKSLPLGFDYYYWGQELYKNKLREKIKNNEFSKSEFLELFPKECEHCLGERWNNETLEACKHCEK